MKKLNLLFTALLLLCCVGTAKAHDFEVDGIYYNITDATNKTVAVTYYGGSYNYVTNEYTGSVVIPESVVCNGKAYSITSIGREAFAFCSGLTSITIPNSVTSIGNCAFYNCSGLTSVTIPNSVTSIGDWAFNHCSWLTNIEIPNSVTSIGESAFRDCSGLTSIEIPNSVTSIGSSAFNGCSGLTSVEIPNSVTSIGDGAFNKCTGLTSVVIGNSVTSIGEMAFSYCSGLTSIKIPNSVKSIGREAFVLCSGLTSVTIGYSVESIGDYAFDGCSGLTSVTIPSSVTSIGFGVFQGCSELESVVVDPSNTKYDSRGNCNAIIETESNTLFAGFNNTIIPNSVTSIGYRAFEYCLGLTSIEIPNSVKGIGWYAFYGCSGLTSVTISNSVTSIEWNAFDGCKNLTDVYCLATDVPSTSSSAFNNSFPENITLHVPAEAINSYKITSPWSSFGNIVALKEEFVETPKCATPVIEYNNGKLTLECDTENAEIVTKITSNDINSFYGNTIELTVTYNISVYATASGYENSDTINATLCWIECDCNADDNTGIIDIPAKAVLVTSNNGTINITCSLEGESVAVYTTSCTLIATTTIENGAATVTTGLSKGSVAIVKIGNKSIKVIID